MNDDQITTLAREYAEECCPIEAYEKAELIDPYKEEVFERKADILATQIEFEQFLEWLLRRYALVEKSKQNERWIPISENHPEPMQRVLVWIGDEALVCWYTKSGRFKTTLHSQERYVKDSVTSERFHLSPCREDVTDIATHWKPIIQPEIAKEVEG